MGDLQILDETVLTEIPRSRDGSEVLRVTYTRAKKPDGSDAAWHSIRVYFKDRSNVFRPGKQGITIRHKELRAVYECLCDPASKDPA